MTVSEFKWLVYIGYPKAMGEREEQNACFGFEWADNTYHHTHEQCSLQQDGCMRRISAWNPVHLHNNWAFDLMQAFFQRCTDGGIVEQTTREVGGLSGRWRRVVILPLGEDMLVPWSGLFLSALFLPISPSFCRPAFAIDHLQLPPALFLPPYVPPFSGTINFTPMNTNQCQIHVK